MSIFFISGREAQQSREDALLAQPQRPGFWDDPQGDGGIIEGLGNDIFRALARAGEGLSEAARLNWMREHDFGLGPATGALLDSMLPQEPTDWDKYFAENRDDHARTRRELTVDPNTRSEAANMIGNLADVLTTYSSAAIVGGPAAAITGPVGAGIGFGREEEERLLAQGADPETARRGGVFTGAMMAAMGAAPVSLPGRIWQRAASGAGINLAFGAVQRGGMNAYLTERGYGEGSDNNLAEQYKWLDPQAAAIDAIFGAVFGAAFGRRGANGEAPPAPTEAELRIARAALVEADSINRATAFGIPENQASRRWQSEALARMEEQAARDEPIDPGPMPEDVGFVPLPETGAPEWEGAMRAFEEEARAQGLEDVASRIKRLREERPDAFDGDQGALFSMRRGVGDERGRVRFNDDRLTDQQNKAVEMRHNGFPPGEAADELQVSESRYWEILKEAREAGVEVPRVQPGPPRTVRNEVLRLTLANPKFTSAQIAERVRSMGYGTTARSVRRAWEMLRAEGALPPAAGPRQRGALFSMGARPVFESMVERTLARSTTARASGAQWWATISKATGVKREELEWIGLEDWLKARDGQITREEVLQFVRENGVRVEETVLGGEGSVPVRNEEEIQRQLLPLIEESERLSRERGRLLDLDDGSGDARLAEIRARQDELGDLIDALQGRDDEPGPGPREPRWSAYQLPGGSEYRELLLRLPIAPDQAARDARMSEIDAELQAIPPDARFDARRQELRADYRDLADINQKNAPFRSSHFDQPNILAHVRFNERTDSQGRRTLFIEEVQSDWHQAGRERGYAGDLDPEQAAEYRALEVEAEQLSAQFGGMRGLLREVASGNQAAVAARARKAEIAARLQELDGLRGVMRTANQGQTIRVPDAPFKNNAWASLSMKRMIRWAAENGFDQIAWTRGQHQLERFNIEKVVDRVEYDTVNPTGGYFRAFKDGQMVSGRAMAPAELPELIGKELAQRLLAAPENAGVRSLEGSDLRYGGEGMRAFYDRILPNIANDLGKKFGARVGETTIFANAEYRDADAAQWMREGDTAIASETNPQTVHSLPITPEMRDQALEGQALFSQSAREGFSTVEELQAQASEILGADWGALSRAGKVEIVQSSADVPAPMGLPRGVQAVHMRDTGTSYFIANNIRPEDLYGLVLHEVGVHNGFEAMLGKRGFNEVLRQIERMIDEDHPAMVEARGIAERYAANEAHVPEETLAYLIETHADLPLVQRVLSRIRQWLIKTFGSTFGMRLTVDDLRALAITSLRRVAEQARRESADSVEVLPLQEAVYASQRPDASDGLRGQAPDGGSAGGGQVLEGEVISPNRLAATTTPSARQGSRSEAIPEAMRRTRGLIDIGDILLGNRQATAEELAMMSPEHRALVQEIWARKTRPSPEGRSPTEEMDFEARLDRALAGLDEADDLAPERPNAGARDDFPLFSWGKTEDGRPVRPLRELGPNGLPIRDSEGTRNSLRGGSEDLVEAAKMQRERQEAYDKLSPAWQALADNPDLFFSFGPPRRRALSGRDLMEQAKAESEAAREMRKGFEAAARCAARYGASSAVRGVTGGAMYVGLTGNSIMMGQALGLAAAVPMGITVAPILARSANPRRYAEGRLAAAEASLRDAEARNFREGNVRGERAGLDAPMTYDTPEGEPLWDNVDTSRRTGDTAEFAPPATPWQASEAELQNPGLEPEPTTFSAPGGGTTPEGGRVPPAPPSLKPQPRPRDYSQDIARLFDMPEDDQ